MIARHGKPGSLAKNRLGNIDALVLWLISGVTPSGNKYHAQRERKKWRRFVRSNEKEMFRITGQETHD